MLWEKMVLDATVNYRFSDAETGKNWKLIKKKSHLNNWLKCWENAIIFPFLKKYPKDNQRKY